MVPFMCTSFTALKRQPRWANVFLIIASLIVVTYEIVHDTDEDSIEQSRTDPLRLCKNLRNYSQRFAMDEFVETLKLQWINFYPEESGSESRSTNELKLNEVLETCKFAPKRNTKVMRFNADNEPEPAGEIDIRTTDLTHGNLVIKLGRKKPPCASLRQLLHCLEADGFRRMYPNERVIVLALNFHASVDSVINEWIALLYLQGEIVDAQHSTKCLHSKDFSDLKYKEKPIIEYFPSQ